MPTIRDRSYPKRLRDARAEHDLRVLLLDGAGIGRDLAGQLVSRGARVYSADERPMRVQGVLGQEIVPATHPGFIPALSRLVQRHGIDVLIPVSTVALQRLSVARWMFPTGVEIIAPPAGAMAVLGDRLLVAANLWAHGVRVPSFGVPSDFADAEAALRLMVGEFVLRARFVDDRHTTTLVRTPGELDWAALGDDSLVQQFVPGAAYAVVIHRPANGGRRLTAVLEKTIRADGEVVTSRMRINGTVAEVERVAQATVRALGLTGPAEVMIRTTSQGTPIVLDVRAGFGPHTRMVPDLLDAVLDSHGANAKVVDVPLAVGAEQTSGPAGKGPRQMRGQR